MHCSSCKVRLQPAVHHGVEIDFCPSCHGVWFDRGELDKIIEKVTAGPAPPAYPPPPAQVSHPHLSRKGSKKEQMVMKLFDLFT